VALMFRGESRNKVDGKGRMSIPAKFRRVLEAGDPDWKSGENPNLVIVYGGKTRDFLECFTVEAMNDVVARIMKMPRGSKKRLALSKLYLTQSLEVSVDETGRLVLPKEQRDKVGLESMAFFGGKGDTFEIWNPETYDATQEEALEADGDFDPDADPSIYLDGDEDF
jgi:MraZ protein